MFPLDFPGFDSWFLWTLAVFAVGALIFAFFHLRDVWSRYRELHGHRKEANRGWTWADFGYLMGLTEPDLPPAYKLEESELQERHHHPAYLQTRDEPVNRPARLS